MATDRIPLTPSPKAVPNRDAFDADATLRSVDGPSRRRLTAAVSACGLVVYAAYLTYRAVYTLNPNALVFSSLVLFAEAHGLLSLALYFHQSWHLRKRTVPSAPPGLTVDVFVTTYNEDVDLVRQTLRAAIGVRYPHRTYLLDDGNRPEMRSLAHELGCQYATRSTNEHAKAGNWNNAYRQTSADFIATFDADHVPQPDFLDRTLGFFRDARVAFVQVPQQYHNLDSVQHRVSWKQRRLYGEQDAFFNLVMPGKDHWNAAFFCGTGAVFRRAALAPHHGLLTDTITEDLHTSIVLHSKGWKSIYLNERLVTGLAPVDLKSFATQRLRWAEGNLKAATYANPLTLPGLTLAQRISYFASLYHWTIGIPKIIFYLAPPVILFTGTFPIVRLDQTFAVIYSVFLVSLVASYQVVSRGKGRLLMDELFNMVSFFTLLRAMKRALFGRGRPGRFEVTDKRGSSRDLRPVLPHLLLLGFSTLAIAWSLMGLGFGVNDDIGGSATIIFWTLYNARLMVGALKLGGRPSEKRRVSRFRANFAVESRADQTGDDTVGVTSDISEGGCSLLWPKRLTVGQQMPIRLYFGSQTADWVGVVESDQGRRADGWFQHGVRFLNLTARDVDLINDTVFSVVVPDLFTTLSQPSWGTRRWRRLVRLASRVAPRNARRQLVRVPARLSHAGGTFITTVRDLSATGLSVQAPVPIALGSVVTVTMMTPIRTWSGAASVVRSDARPSRSGFETWVLGLKFETEQRRAQIRPFRRWDAA